MNKGLKNNEKGITLLALLITIIILIVLAGVAISSIINENLFDRAEKSKFVSQIGELKEKIQLHKQEVVIDKYTGKPIKEIDYSSIVPEDLSGYIDVNSDGIILFKGDADSKLASWSKEIGIIVKEPEVPEVPVVPETPEEPEVPEEPEQPEVPEIPEEPEVPEEPDEKTKFIMQVTELSKKIEENVSNTGINYSSLIPSEIAAYIEVSNTGVILFRGDKNSEQATWSKELGIRGVQEYTIETLLGELVDLAKKYITQTGSTKNANQLALQYIRRNRYKGGNWDSVAGTIDANFVTYVDNNKTQYLDISLIKDPNTDNTIDFVHSMASVNAYLKTAPSDNVLAQYSCWAGDLCTLTTEIYNYNKSGSYTAAQLKTYTQEKLCGSSTFSLEDMLADADAVNIWQLIKSGKDLDDAIYGYYYGNGTSTCANRYNKFGSYLGTLYSGSSDYNKIYNACIYYLGATNEWFSWGEIYASQLIENHGSIPKVVFQTVATCFAEYVSQRM